MECQLTGGFVIDWQIRRLTIATSTNDDVKKVAEAGEAEGLVVWALEQTAGRGRHGRVWESPEGNLYASLLLRPGCEAKHVGQYAFVAALALHDTVRALLPAAKVTLKWPNDILVEGKKISGILLEAAPAKNDKIDWLVAGIGLNVAHHPDHAHYPATSLHAINKALPPLKAILDLLLERFSYWKNMLLEQGVNPVHEAWLAVAEKGHLTVRLPNQTIEGAFAGLDADGNLILQSADGTKKTISAGDVLAA
jgi:BirA family biotin operon repressor/biotin-[acetyl-CoA-carboxylase] ligase